MKFMSILPAGVSLRQNHFTSIHMDTYIFLPDVTPTSSWEQPCLIILQHLLLWRWHKSLKALWPWHSVCERLRQNKIHVKATTDVLLFKVSVLQHNGWIENHWNNSLSSQNDPHMTASTEHTSAGGCLTNKSAEQDILKNSFNNLKSISFQSPLHLFSFYLFETVSHVRCSYKENNSH